ncbi:hypothetical protein ASG87_00690 [Frateuria sp. Soil773]|uniref:DUF2231 domain-containing protein n=1 Tax=Frateuria sp. Soil773 TaxID=1736407 RepID=UPI0006F684F5|nr:DUF2231 domain-containing protein [Frateuria sp. Soil773]KRE92467.1 hypothetical protein ASG87_00690 [Frateuria sp. Soil773]
MNALPRPRGSVFVDAVYGLLNPLPFGFFVAALIFDILYARTADVQWNNGAAWLNAFGLVLAIVPRLINLARVWITARVRATSADKAGFWLYLVAIVVAIVNAFVHSRDAYAVVPAGVWLSACTVILLSIGQVAMAVTGKRGGLDRE